MNFPFGDILDKAFGLPNQLFHKASFLTRDPTMFLMHHSVQVPQRAQVTGQSCDFMMKRHNHVKMASENDGRNSFSLQADILPGI